MAVVEVTDLVREWGTVRGVDNVSFRTGDVEFVVLLGPSGCGKSTTLRLIAGLEMATSGRVAIAGRDVTALRPAKRGVSMVFQSYALFPHLTAAQNIVFGLSVRGVPRDERDRRLKKTSALLGLDPLLERLPNQLSGGQQQRVALGRALISEASVCLLDEPLSNLDARLRSEMRVEIRSLQQRLGITMIFVTHDQVEAMSMADRIILMRGGKIEENGSPADLYEDPSTVFSGSFIGNPPMNIIDPAKAGPDLFQAFGVAAQPGDDVLIGVRPEHIELADEGCRAQVVSVEYFGADTIVGCTVGAQRMLVREQGRLAILPGAEVRLRWSDGVNRYFRKSTGLRMS